VVSRPASEVDDRAEARADRRAPNLLHHALGIGWVLKQIATHLADEVEVPIGTTCCGTAGDRGLLHPELVVSATREVKAVLDARPAEAYISANRTCEMAFGTRPGDRMSRLFSCSRN